MYCDRMRSKNVKSTTHFIKIIINCIISHFLTSVSLELECFYVNLLVLNIISPLETVERKLVRRDGELKLYSVPVE